MHAMLPPQCLRLLTFDAVKAKGKTSAFPPEQHFPQSKAVPLRVLGERSVKGEGRCKGGGFFEV